MRFTEIMRDRRGFVHKRILGAATGFLGGGGIVGAIGGFLGGGGNGKTPRQPRPGFLGGFLGGRPIPQPTAPPPAFARVPPPLTIAAPGQFPPISMADIPGRRGFHEETGVDLCVPPWFRNELGECKLDLDPGPGRGLPGGPQTDMITPTSVCIETMVCPKFADNKKGVLWMNALSGLVVCLPRGVNGSGWGMIRKNRPRRKAFVTAAEISALRKQATTKKKAKKFAALTGQTCVTRGTAQRSRH